MPNNIVSQSIGKGNNVFGGDSKERIYFAQLQAHFARFVVQGNPNALKEFFDSINDEKMVVRLIQTPIPKSVWDILQS